MTDAAEQAPAGVGREVLYELVDGQIAIIRLNRPDRRNAVDGEITQAMSYLVRTTEADPAIRVVILASSSDAFFCAGADLAAIAAGRKDDLSTADGFAGLVNAERAKPWIAAVAGPVLAGGFELCLACDMIVAADTARFGLPEVKRGLFAASGGVHRTGRVLPRHVAIELIATGDPLDVQRAYALGLVNRIAPPASLLDEALTLARAVAANAPLAVRESIAIAREAGEATDADLRLRSDRAADMVFASEDAAEGPRAFLQKRLPNWTGR